MILTSVQLFQIHITPEPRINVSKLEFKFLTVQDCFETLMKYLQ